MNVGKVWSLPLLLMVNVKGITPMIIYTYSTHIIFWEVDGPEILQNYKEFMNSLSHQVFLHPSTTSQKIRKHTDFRKNRAFSSIVSLRIDSIAAMITKMVPTIRPPDAWLQKHGPRRLNSWDPNKLPYQLILVAYVVILYGLCGGDLFSIHILRGQMRFKKLFVGKIP